jgi:hypothetical protein
MFVIHAAFIVFMAAGTAKLVEIILNQVAIGTVIPFAGMFTGVNRKIFTVVFQIFSGLPVRIGRVAIGTINGKISCDVVGISCIVVIGLMACHTISGEVCKVVIFMTQAAILKVMAKCQREKVMVKIVR